MSISSKKPMAMKICYLRDEKKIKQPQKQDKLSVTYLSSFIQNEKKSMKNISENNESNNIEDHDFQIKRGFTTPNQKYTEHQKQQYPHQAALMYSKWNKTKSKSHQDDQRMLANIVGDNWDSFENKQKLWRGAKKTKAFKTITQKNTYEEMKRKKSNDKMLSQHFHTFLNNQNNKTSLFDSSQADINYYINKIDKNLAFENKHNNFSWMDRNTSNFSHSSQMANNSAKLFDKSNSVDKNNKSVKNPRVIFSSETMRSGFKHIPNFQWSKLNRSNKFKLC